ncbi:ferritin family protein [Thermococcus sp.]|uniref:ferritin family protein n=2 Tax=Thermococcus sp. TaxID=35749 RepID=UPI00262FF842|nr:ferritin family protein [Thermococcus sp.]
MPPISPELRDYMNRIIETLRDKPVKEILSYAIFNEQEEAEYYRKLARHTPRESVKALFLQMADESAEHYKRLYELFKKLYPNEEPVEVEAPPVEVAPFYPKFESVDDYLEALEYCMKSELFAKDTYEILSQRASSEDARIVFVQLSNMEKEHYMRIKKAYDLLAEFRDRRTLPENLEPGAYLFPDKVKARYVLLDLIANAKDIYVFSRDPPKKLREWFKRGDINFAWISTAPVKGSITPKMLIESGTGMCELLKKGNVVLLVENFEVVAMSVGFKKAFECVSMLRDAAIMYGSYLLVHANRPAMSEREWAVLEAEFEVIG